jgi:hypothetical protein
METISPGGVLNPWRWLWHGIITGGIRYEREVDALGALSPKSTGEASGATLTDAGTGPSSAKLVIEAAKPAWIGSPECSRCVSPSGPAGRPISTLAELATSHTLVASMHVLEFT